MMLAAMGTQAILRSRAYLFEPKLDGYRALCQKKGTMLRLVSRNDRDITGEFPELSIGHLIKADCTLDGEIVVYDAKGNPSFALMQQRKRLRLSPTYVAFDILELEGRDLRRLPLTERKQLLAGIVEEGKNLQTMPSTENGEELWNVAMARGIEGVVAKKKESAYVTGRSRSWLKIKLEKTADCVIIGYATKTRTIASLALGLYDGGALTYIGQVGTGFNALLLERLSKQLIAASNDVALPKNVRPVIPASVCEVRYLEFTNGHRLRAPVFLRLRDDKDASECTIDQVLKNA
jgi:bifunctional non-homologous end joining protein LigD